MSITRRTFIKTFAAFRRESADPDTRLMASMLFEILNDGDIDEISDRYASQILEAQP
jgi:hypothetical protein